MNKILASFILFLCFSSCAENEKAITKNDIYSPNPFTLKIPSKEQIHNASLNNEDRYKNKEVWLMDAYWGNENLVLKKVFNQKIPLGVKVLEFVDDSKVLCKENIKPDCGMGAIIYDTLKWNLSGNKLSLNVSGVQIGNNPFNHDYVYQHKKLDNNTITLKRMN